MRSIRPKAGVPRAFLASFLLHGGLLGGLGFALATEPGKPPILRVDAAMETPVVLDREIEPIPEAEPPAAPSVPVAAEYELAAELVADIADPRFTPDAAVGAPSEGGAAAIGVGGGGLRVRPRRAPAPVAAAGGEDVAVPLPAPPAPPAPPAGPSVRARPLPDACGEPVYPPRERRLGIEGVVLLLARIDPRGVVGAVDVLESSGAVALDRAAVDAVLDWRFSPAMEAGTPVEDSLRLRVTFSLVEAGRITAGR